MTVGFGADHPRAGAGAFDAHVLADPLRHGDSDAVPGLVDFAVNVRGGPPDFVLDAIRAGIDDLARYPSAADERAAVETIAEAHGRHPDEVLLLSGAADGFEMLPRLAPTHAALVQPSFTEPEIALRAAGIPITHVTLAPPWRLDPTSSEVPDSADLVLLGNPTNPTSVLHAPETIGALRRPGRLVVVDEAFADLTLDGDGRAEPFSLAGESWHDLIVIRSVTKTFGLAGLRAGYLLAAPEVVTRLRAGRRPWALSTPALAALRACLSEQGRAYCLDQARKVAAEREAMLTELSCVGVEAASHPSAPFVLVFMPQATEVKRRLVDRGYAVRSCANFVGLGDEHLRLAVRPLRQVQGLARSLAEVREEMADELIGITSGRR